MLWLDIGNMQKGQNGRCTLFLGTYGANWGRSKVIVTVIIGEIFQHPINAATKGSSLDDDDWCGGTAQVNCYD